VKYVTRSHELVVVSTSLLDFELQIALLDGTVIKEGSLKSREYFVFEVNEDFEQILLRVKQTKVQETIDMASLKVIDTSDIPNYKGNLVIYIAKKVIKFLIIMASIVGVLGVAFYQYRKKQS
jgi:hypothetical protein